jgi:hypothetical protein
MEKFYRQKVEGMDLGSLSDDERLGGALHVESS